MKVEKKLSESFRLLGIKPKISSFSERKRLQKLTYLLEKSGVHLGFNFSWYIHGPYSPTLTRVLYKNDREEFEREVNDDKDDNKRIKFLKEFLGSDIKSSNTLELIVSLHYLIEYGLKKQKSDQEIIQLFFELKPQFVKENIKYYFDRIKTQILESRL